jgi:hypothetical protein
MSKGPEIDAAAARKVVDACSEFKLPKASEVMKCMARQYSSYSHHEPTQAATAATSCCCLAQKPLTSVLLQEELRSLSREEWMQRFGGMLQSEQHFEKRSPAWNYDQNSWWVPLPLPLACCCRSRLQAQGSHLASGHRTVPSRGSLLVLGCS